MNKLTKGAIATGIGTALLLGGGATLALWNDSVNIGSGAEINSGVLTIDGGSGTWTDGPVLWVPGDSITYDTTVEVVATGDNLLANLDVIPGDMTVGGDLDLFNALDFSIEVGSVSNGNFELDTLVPGAYRITPDDKLSGTPMTVTLTVTVSFPESVSGLTAQDMHLVNLADMQLVLNQVTA